jgi:hypothetical protein
MVGEIAVCRVPFKLRDLHGWIATNNSGMVRECWRSTHPSVSRSHVLRGNGRRVVGRARAWATGACFSTTTTSLEPCGGWSIGPDA